MTLEQHETTVNYRKLPGLQYNKRKCMELQDIYNENNEEKDKNCLCTVSDREKFIRKYFNWYNYKK